MDQATTVGNEVHEQKTAVPVEVLQPGNDTYLAQCWLTDAFTV